MKITDWLCKRFIKNRKSISQAGIQKKSFELYYNGGAIWAEHLDGMGQDAEKVKEKFLDDFETFSRPSISSFIIINLDETELDNGIVSCITNTIINSPKKYMKIAFVGVKKSEQAEFRKIQEQKKCAICFLNDYEKAKQWVLP